MKFTEIIKTDTNFDFLGKSRMFLMISTIAVVLSLIAVAIPGGLVLGVDFRGGSDILLSLPAAKADRQNIEATLRDAGYQSPQVQVYGEVGADQKSGFLVRLSEVSSFQSAQVESFQKAMEKKGPNGTTPNIRFDEQTRDKIQVSFTEPVKEDIVIEALTAAGLKYAEEKNDTGEKKITGDYTLRGRTEQGATTEGEESESRSFQILPTGLSNSVSNLLTEKLGLQAGDVKILNATSVGPKAGEQLRNDGIRSILFAMLLIMLFIALRFDFRYAPGAVVAIIHDVAITAAVFVIARIEFNLPAIAALLTITGYSLNDTVVVYDRIRENAQKNSLKSLRDITNRSVNEMLGRTILVSGTTFTTVTALMILGGSQIRGFAIALAAGIVIGTYSSIYIAAPILLWADEWLKKRMKIEETPEPTDDTSATNTGGRSRGRRARARG